MEHTFRVTYDGPALEHHLIEVQDFAPAILALSQLFEVTSAVLYPDRPRPSLAIKATPAGSFAVDLVLSLPIPLTEDFIDLLASREVTAIGTLFGVVAGASGGVKGLFGWIKKLNNRKIESVTDSGGNMVTVTTEDGEKIQVPEVVLRVFQDRPDVQDLAQQVVEPLHQPGIEKFKIADDTADESQPRTLVQAKELPAFESSPPALADDKLVNTREALVTIVSPAFDTGKWRLHDAERPFWASMEDDHFRQRMAHRVEGFHQGDLLRCKIRSVQAIVSGQPGPISHHIDKVINHYAGGVQLSLDDSIDGQQSDAA